MPFLVRDNTMRNVLTRHADKHPLGRLHHPGADRPHPLRPRGGLQGPGRAARPPPGVGLLPGGCGVDELQSAGAYRVYEDPADLLLHLDEVGVRRAV